jgi:hypothetical protein
MGTRNDEQRMCFSLYGFSIFRLRFPLLQATQHRCGCVWSRRGTFGRWQRLKILPTSVDANHPSCGEILCVRRRC